METFAPHTLLLSFALLGWMVQSVNLSEIEGSGEDWPPARERSRRPRSTEQLNNTVTGVLLIPSSTDVPLGGQFQFHCMGSTEPDCGGYEGWLYKVVDHETGVFQPVQVQRYHTCSCGGRCLLNTTFVMTAATVEAAGTYGCVMLRDGPPTETTVARGFGIGYQPHEANVTVCLEPDLALLSNTQDSDLIIRVEEKCKFLGEVSWIINGHRVGRRSTESSVADPSLPAFQRDDDTLLIQCDQGNPKNSWCTVKAEFKYITNSRRLEVATGTLNVSDCCLENPSTEAAFTDPVTTQDLTGYPVTQGPIEEEPSRKEKWALKKEVLELKKKVLPLQIRFFRNWSKVNPYKIRDVIEDGALEDI
ncbi:uncharacterized protein LOC110991026 isoform X2 [Acanthaster planci]|uniref:Uncharacterized protein LOC110991026 isoform X2 n=1 Tax=Acanthaster planci TaxID=133434 RepID=A0A8B8A281_ACAPL|nr:uncharacterized protein LOC110991026 isoform X2 [Acanthaster planci]